MKLVLGVKKHPPVKISKSAILKTTIENKDFIGAKAKEKVKVKAKAKANLKAKARRRLR